MLNNRNYNVEKILPSKHVHVECSKEKIKNDETTVPVDDEKRIRNYDIT